MKFMLALTLPIFAAAIWGIFAVPDDPSRSGNAPVIAPGLVRIVIELAFFRPFYGHYLQCSNRC